MMRVMVYEAAQILADAWFHRSPKADTIKLTSNVSD